jgi:hypothetical protein
MAWVSAGLAHELLSLFRLSSVEHKEVRRRRAVVSDVRVELVQFVPCASDTPRRADDFHFDHVVRAEES